jgi:1-deoxy-D-xylulose-5-phosphate synthase
LRLGLPDRFIDHGDSALLLVEAGLDDTGIVRSVNEKLGAANNS